MNTFGAALATVISQGFSFLLGFICLYKMKDEIGLEIKLKKFRMKWAYLKPSIFLGTPMAFESVSVQFSMLFVNSWINSYRSSSQPFQRSGTRSVWLGTYLRTQSPCHRVR